MARPCARNDRERARGARLPPSPRAPRRRACDESGGYEASVEPDAIDLYRFQRLVEEGSRALAAGAAAEAADRLRSGLSLWRGPPLADFTYEPFAEPAIRRLEELRLAALENRIDADFALGRHGDLAGELQSLVLDNPKQHGCPESHSPPSTATVQAAACRADTRIVRVAAALSCLVAALGVLSGCGLRANGELRTLVEAAAPPGSSLKCEWGSSSYEDEPKSWLGCWAYVLGSPSVWLAP